MATRKQIAQAVDIRLAAATAAGKVRRQRGDVATSAEYDSRSKRLRIELASGAAVAVPVGMIEGLAGVAEGRIKAMQIDGKGYALRWPELDLDVSIPDLIAGSFGTRSWMSALARQGGKVTSIAKAAAARENGKKGGRPRTVDGTGDAFADTRRIVARRGASK